MKICNIPNTINGNYDLFLQKGLDNIKSNIEKKDDDQIIIIVGETGSGKSHLGLHILDYYLKDFASINNVALNRSSFASSLKAVTSTPKPRCLIYDESNINKRESGTKFNRDVMDLYMAIRGLNVLHIWCNPSLDMMDKFFIQERIKAVILCPSKNPHIRPYFYFPTRSILNILEKYKTLKLPVLKRKRKEFASYRGWYKAYDGKLLQPYLDKKENRMNEKVTNFFDKWANDTDKGRLTARKVKNILNISTSTLYKYKNTLLEKGILKENEDYVVGAGNKLLYEPSAVDKFMKLKEDNAQNCSKNILKANNKVTEVA